jgi:hypothetical protein
MRLGDEVDDHCSRCRRATDHSVVSLVDDGPGKVRCRTCNYEHGYRKNKGKKEMTVAQAFDKVLASVMNTAPGLQSPADAKTKKPRSKR